MAREGGGRRAERGGWWYCTKALGLLGYWRSCRTVVETGGRGRERRPHDSLSSSSAAPARLRVYPHHRSGSPNRCSDPGISQSTLTHRPRLFLLLPSLLNAERALRVASDEFRVLLAKNRRCSTCMRVGVRASCFWSPARVQGRLPAGREAPEGQLALEQLLSVADGRELETQFSDFQDSWKQLYTWQQKPAPRPSRRLATPTRLGTALECRGRS